MSYPAFYVPSQVLITCLSIITTIICFICIHWHSDRHLSKAYKRLIMLHCIFAPAYAISLSTGSLPIILVPCLAGYPIGFLSFINMDTTQQMVVFGQLCQVDCLIVLLLFYYRFSILQPATSIFATATSRNFFYKFVGLVSFISIFYIFFPLYNVEQLKMECVKKIGYYPKEMDYPLTRAYSIFKSGPFYLYLYSYVIFGMFFIGIVPGCLAFWTYKAIDSQSMHLSAFTLKAHSQLMKTLIVQSLIQLACVTVPFGVFFIIALAEIKFLAESMAHLCVMAVGCSGFFAPSYIIFSTRSYRTYILSYFPCYSRSVRTTIQTMTEKSTRS